MVAGMKGLRWLVEEAFERSTDNELLEVDLLGGRSLKGPLTEV